MRPSRDQIYLEMAKKLAGRGTCRRRKVACILTNDRGHVLSTGYNGPPSGWKHCTINPCPGSGEPSGSGLEKCEAIHAEQNALLQCPDVNKISTCYVTHSPCVHCTKLLLNTSCFVIMFSDDYTHESARTLWERAGRSWERYEAR